jgi:methyl-accepting chemotaxis protein
MTKFETDYRSRANRMLVIVLWSHLPVAAGLALLHGTSFAAAVVGSLALCAAPSILVRMKPWGLAASIAIACSTMGFSALLIYLGGGKIEYHFHVFSFLAVITAMCQPWAQLAAALTIAAHHVVGWLLVPRAIFNYEAALSDVALHALFVVIETAICLRIVWQLSATVQARGILEEQVAVGAASVGAGTKEIVSFMRTLAGTASTQAQLVDQVAEASSRIAGDWRDKESAALESRKGLAEAVQRLGQCQSSLEAVNTDMRNLADANRRVAGVMTLVTDIARQTNILAINASIEASRSGAAGAGFGIIADQVRDLARRTADAARDIESVVSESTETVERNSDAVEELTRSMRVVAKSSEGMMELSGEIVGLGQAQGRELGRISAAIQKISAETQHLAAGAEQSSGTTSELARLAEDLNATLASIR